MAAPELHKGAKAQSNSSLLDCLSAVLPKGYKFSVYHVSTPPTRSDALCSAPPEERPDKTYCENHFLGVSIDSQLPTDNGSIADTLTINSPSPAKQVLIFALEVFVFTTAYTSIIFVSKADSTGYLHLLNLTKGTLSPIREVSTAFVSYLVEQRRRRDVQTIVTLFARAQGQYLFPGSVENKGKHVLDDRGLVKWWCKVLNPLLDERKTRPRSKNEQPWGGIKGYLIVPGLDHYETRAFLPRTPDTMDKWMLGHPLERISHYSREYDWVPPRCLIPRYPDDPKSRFRDELDEEAGKWKQTTGAWKSVKTVDQFWEMMAFRQECSSGRLTGFVWVVFDPKNSNATADSTSTQSIAFNPLLLTPTSSFDSALPAALPSTPPRPRDPASRTPQSAPKRLNASPTSSKSTPSKIKAMEMKKEKRKTKKLTGPIISRQPHIKTEQRNYLLDRPTSTAYYYWPAEGRGERIVDEGGYKRIVELLLHLDFATLEKAVTSTKRWVNEVGMGRTWGTEVVGDSDIPASGRAVNGADPGVVNNLSGMVKRKRPVEAERPQNGNDASGSTTEANVLGAGLVRKKRKVADGGRMDTS